MVLSVVAGTAALTGTAAAASDVSITADDQNARAQGVTYTASGTVEVGNSTQNLTQVEVDLGNASVSGVSADEVTVTINGEEYLAGYESFTASDGTVTVTLATPQTVTTDDTVTVTTAGVTNPDANVEATVSLKDEGGALPAEANATFDTFADTVSIDPIAYSILWVNATSTARNSEIKATAIVTNTADEEAQYNASFVVDGQAYVTKSGTLQANGRTRLTFTPEFPAAGNYDISIESLSPQPLTVYDDVKFVGARSDAAGDAQSLTVSVADLSLDNGTDWHYVQLPDALADRASLEDISISGYNVSFYKQTDGMVEGADDDGVADTLRFATTGAGGGTTNALITATVALDEGVEAGDYPVTFHAIDSKGRSAIAANLTELSVAAEQTTTATQTATETETETESNGSGGVPGFTAGAALVAAALLGAALLVRRN